MMVQLSLLTVVSVQLFRYMGWGTAAFTITSFFINPLTMSLSMQFASIYILTMLTVLTVLYLRQKGLMSEVWKVFVFCGISVAYFDFLTYPIVSLGIPLILCLSLENKTWRQGIIDIITRSALWGMSYLSMWAGKWIVASVLFGTNVFEDGMNSVRSRTSDIDDSQNKLTFISVVRKNLEAADARTWLYILLLFIAVILVMLCFRKFKIVITKKLIPVFIVMLYPLLWYFVVRNHSAIHDWMTFRNLAITLYGAFMIMHLAVRQRKKN